MKDFDLALAKKQITEFIKQHSPKNGVVLGLSGGIDSALVLALCVQALGKDKVLGLFMAEEEAQISETIEDYARALGVGTEVVPIRPILEAFIANADIEDNQTVRGNLKARIRMSLLYTRANALGKVVMGTGNRSELLLGYFTKYGDGGVDFLPIGDLYKAQVRKLAEASGVPAAIIAQPPSAGLWEGQTDEDELGVTYEKLDRILSEHFDNNVPFNKLDLPGVSKEEIEKVVKRVDAAAPKLTMPPICHLKK